MGETLNLLFRKCEDGTFEIEAKENWAESVIRGSFDPPFQPRQLNNLLKRINTFESDDRALRDIGLHLYQSLFGPVKYGTDRHESSEQPIRAVLRGMTQRAIKQHGSVALTLSFMPECHEFVRYPWELLHNGEHFLLAAGIFTLTRTLVHTDITTGKELPVHPPLRILYIGASPIDYPPLEIENSFEAMEQGLSSLIDDNRLILDRLEPPTFDEFVRYLNSIGGAAAYDESDIAYPCYAIHFDGHGAFRKQCPAYDCDELNPINAQFCDRCGTSLKGVEPQTYLCFCDNDGKGSLIDTETLRELLVQSDVRLAVFAACETAMLSNVTRSHRQKEAVIDATLATSLVVSQVPAVIAMPFSIEDKFSPAFMLHFYEALVKGRTLEEALARARQAMLPLSKHHSWFIPVLYRQVIEHQAGPVAFLSDRSELEEQEHSLTQPGASQNFVGRERELQELSDLLTQSIVDEQQRHEMKSKYLLRLGMHHIAMTGPAGIGKSALAIEAVRRNQEKFYGGAICTSLQGGKSFVEALIEIAQHLHVPTQGMHTANKRYCEQVVLDSYRNRANRGLHCLLLLDRFDDVQERSAVGAWLHFLCALPTQVVVLLTSHYNPETLGVLEGATCHWFEYPVDKMTSEELHKLFTELAETNGLAERIHLDEPEQQAILEEICTLLDGYPLGAELIFGRAQSIAGKIYVPEASTRSLKEVCDELRDSQLDGIAAVFDVSYKLLSDQARLLLPYLAVFSLPFSSEQIVMLVEPKSASTMRTIERLMSEDTLTGINSEEKEDELRAGSILPPELQKNWRSARDELVEASFVQFDGLHYHIHAQIRHFAHTLLPPDEHKRVHRVAAAYYSSLPHPTAEQWFAAFEHLERAGEKEDLQEAIKLANDASWDLQDRGRASELLLMLERAQNHALRLGDKTGEGKIQCCLGAILRELGHYAQATACLTRSLALHRELNEPDEEGWALFELAMLSREEGRFQLAGEHAQEALELFQKAGDKSGVTWMQMVLAEVNRGYGRYQEAHSQLEDVLASFQKLNNEEGYAHALFDRSTIYEASGLYSEALMDSEEALRLFTKLGLRFWQAWVLSEQSVVFLEQGKYDQAERTCSESIAIFRERKALRGEGWALRVLGDIARKRQNYVDARVYYNHSFNLSKEVMDQAGEARVSNSLGAASLAERQIPEAEDHFERARVLAHEQKSLQLEARALRGLGDVAIFQARYPDAEKLYSEAAKKADEVGTPAEQGAVLHRQGQLYLSQGKYREALATFVKAFVDDQRLGHPDREALMEKIVTLVAEQNLQEYYAELCGRYGI